MRSASPLEGKTTDWRAGCGRSASPVRREGGSGTLILSYPYWMQSGHNPGPQAHQAGCPRLRMRSGSCGTAGQPQTPSLAPR
jgi:hypothetical protein